MKVGSDPGPKLFLLGAITGLANHVHSTFLVARIAGRQYPGFPSDGSQPLPDLHGNPVDDGFPKYLQRWCYCCCCGCVI